MFLVVSLCLIIYFILYKSGASPGGASFAISVTGLQVMSVFASFDLSWSAPIAQSTCSHFLCSPLLSGHASGAPLLHTIAHPIALPRLCRPPALQAFLDSLKFALISPEVAAPECQNPALNDYQTKWTLYMTLPLVFLGVALFAWSVHLLFIYAKGKIAKGKIKDDTEPFKDKRWKAIQLHCNAYVNCLMVMFLKLAQTAMEVYDCLVSPTPTLSLPHRQPHLPLRFFCPPLPTTTITTRPFPLLNCTCLIMMQVPPGLNKAILEADPTVVCWEMPFEGFAPDYADLRWRAHVAVVFYVLALPLSILVPYLIHRRTKTLYDPNSQVEPFFRCFFSKYVTRVHLPVNVILV